MDRRRFVKTAVIGSVAISAASHVQAAKEKTSSETLVCLNELIPEVPKNRLNSVWFAWAMGPMEPMGPGPSLKPADIKG